MKAALLALALVACTAPVDPPPPDAGDCKKECAAELDDCVASDGGDAVCMPTFDSCLASCGAEASR